MWHRGTSGCLGNFRRERRRRGVRAASGRTWSGECRGHQAEGERCASAGSVHLGALQRLWVDSKGSWGEPGTPHHLYTLTLPLPSISTDALCRKSSQGRRLPEMAGCPGGREDHLGGAPGDCAHSPASALGAPKAGVRAALEPLGRGVRHPLLLLGLSAPTWKMGSCEVTVGTGAGLAWEVTVPQPKQSESHPAPGPPVSEWA